MKTISTNLYEFKELSPEAQQKAIDKYRDFNTDYEWWEYIYDDAKEIGLKINGFNEYHVEAKFIDYAIDVANSIIKSHGEHCETYKTATNYIEKYKACRIEYEAEEHDDEIDTEDIDREFLKSLSEDYRMILSKEYEYLTSDEAIKETLIANEYYFTENGDIYHG